MCGVKYCACLISCIGFGVMYFMLYVGPQTKLKLMLWKAKRENAILADSDCPVDGGWSTWSSWSPCQGLCDNVGFQKRYRLCNNPVPTENGMPCYGPDEDIQSCYLSNCSVNDFRLIVEGDIYRLNEFHQLLAVPALMERCLKEECPFEAIELAVESDNSYNLDAEVLWNALLCVKHNLGCPIRGEWGTWGSWSACGARCGYGFRRRLRRCDSPPPSNFHLLCINSPLETETCEGSQCAIDMVNVQSDPKANWGDWGNWTDCSENCGVGVRRRRRICNEAVETAAFGTWGTHCLGLHDEIEACENKYCVMDGGWSGWGPWSPCSQTCGVGKRIRSRSCTRPVTNGNGFPCIGPKTETGTCYLGPCQVLTHTVALMNGDTTLQYRFDNKRSMLLHFFVRFLLLSSHGTIFRRGEENSPQVHLGLQRGKLCLDANGESLICSLPTICSSLQLETAVWHNALITITNEVATLRIDDAPVPIKETFPCDPELLDDKMLFVIGDKMRGAIQQLVLNFIPLNLNVNHDRSKPCNYCPTSASNVMYETAPFEEGYLFMENDQYLRLPCFDTQQDWRLDLTIKSKKDSGTILFIRDDSNSNWLYLGLQNMRLKLKVKYDDFKSESSTANDCPSNEWLDVALIKNKESNTIEASVNSDERIHVVLEEEDIIINRIDSTNKYKLGNIKSINDDMNQVKDNFENKYILAIPFLICDDEYFVGAVPEDLKRFNFSDEITSFSGIIASMSVNKVLLDLHDVNVERYKDSEIQVSSRTASVSGSYHETAWGKSDTLNLTCIHARTARVPQKAHWLYLDTDIQGTIKGKRIRSVDDGRVLRLVAHADNDLKGFYTCRARNYKRTRNIITYGVIGKIKISPSNPDTITAFVVVSTFALIIGTISWLLVEGFNDIRNGFGFYRDGHLSPEEEAEAVCKYIDDHIHLYTSESIANEAKEIARSRGRRLASRLNFGAQEPQGMELIQGKLDSNDSSFDLAELPALPIKTSMSPINPQDEGSDEVYKCEPSFISSPRHGSNLTSPRTKFTSSTSQEKMSAKVVCSRLLLPKQILQSKETLKYRMKFPRTGHFERPRKIRSNLLTIKSSSCIEISPVQKVLMKFKQLKSDDD